jgi:hypothetical protein
MQDRERVDQLLAIVSTQEKRKLTNSELLQRQRMWCEAVHPLQGWGTCFCGAQAPYRIGENRGSSASLWAHEVASDVEWACRNHAREHAHRWGLLFEQWYWEPIVAEWMLGPVIEYSEQLELRRAPLPRVRLIRCSHPDHPEGAGCTWPNGMLPFRCAGCSTRLGVSEEIQLQTFRACAAGPEKVFLMCDDCTRTAIAALQFLRWKNHREAHVWVLNVLKRDGRMRERWETIKTFIDRYQMSY